MDTNIVIALIRNQERERERGSLELGMEDAREELNHNTQIGREGRNLFISDES